MDKLLETFMFSITIMALVVFSTVIAIIGLRSFVLVIESRPINKLLSGLSFIVLTLDRQIKMEMNTILHSQDLQALYELVQDIDTNNIDPVVVLRYETFYNRGVSIGAFNRSMANRGAPYRILKHDDPKKVWLHLREEDLWSRY